MADDATLSSVGFGTYNGLILVFLKSSPTTDVPLGTTIPPLTPVSYTHLTLPTNREV